jgi:hypothetical protein
MAIRQTLLNFRLLPAQPALVPIRVPTAARCRRGADSANLAKVRCNLGGPRKAGCRRRQHVSSLALPRLRSTHRLNCPHARIVDSPAPAINSVDPSMSAEHPPALITDGAAGCAYSPPTTGPTRHFSSAANRLRSQLLRFPFPPNAPATPSGRPEPRVIYCQIDPRNQIIKP